MSIAGTYEFVSGENYDEYLKAVGVGMINRTLAGKAKPTMVFTDLGNGKWSQKTQTTLKNFEIVFVLGEEFQETTADDRKSKSVITLEGNTLIHKQTIDKYTATTTRVFTPTDMVTTFATGAVVATRTFKKVA